MSACDVVMLPPVTRPAPLVQHTFCSLAAPTPADKALVVVVTGMRQLGLAEISLQAPRALWCVLRGAPRVEVSTLAAQLPAARS